MKGRHPATGLFGLVLGALCLMAGCAGPRPAERPLGLPPPVLSKKQREAHAEPEPLMGQHRVASGETLYRIAKQYGLSPEALARANGIDDPRSLVVGQELIIPGDEVPAASSGSTGPKAIPGLRPVTPSSHKPESPSRAAAPRASRNVRPTRVSSPYRGTLQWPLRGVLYGRFGRKGREPHDGIDLAAPAGTVVRTARAGRVVFAGEQRGYGLIVIVEHGPSLITLYAHNRDLRVRTGQGVREQQVIATVGESGKTSGPHLHFEVRQDGTPVDPLLYLGAFPPSS